MPIELSTIPDGLINPERLPDRMPDFYTVTIGEGIGVGGTAQTLVISRDEKIFVGGAICAGVSGTIISGSIGYGYIYRVDGKTVTAEDRDAFCAGQSYNVTVGVGGAVIGTSVTSDGQYYSQEYSIGSPQLTGSQIDSQQVGTVRDLIESIKSSLTNTSALNQTKDQEELAYCSSSKQEILKKEMIPTARAEDQARQDVANLIAEQMNLNAEINARVDALRVQPEQQRGLGRT